MALISVLPDTRVFLVVGTGYAFTKKADAQDFANDQDWQPPPKIVRVSSAYLPEKTKILVLALPPHKAAEISGG